MRDPQIAKLMKALARRLPGTTLTTRPMRDQPGSGETLIQVLNAPMDPPSYVDGIAWPLIDELWGAEPLTAYVSAVSPADTAKYHAQDLANARRTRVGRRRRAAAPSKRVAVR